MKKNILICFALLSMAVALPASADERDYRHRHVAAGGSANIYGARGSDCGMAFPSQEELLQRTEVTVDGVPVESSGLITVLPFDPTLGNNGKQRSNSCGREVPFVPVQITIPADAVPGSEFRATFFGDRVRPIVVDDASGTTAKLN